MHNCCVGDVTLGPERSSGGTATGLDRSYRVGVVATVSYRAASQEVFGWNSRYCSPTHTGGISYSADAFPEKAVVRDDVGIGPGDLLCEKVVGAACDYCSCRRNTLLNGRAILRLASRIGHSHALSMWAGPPACTRWADRPPRGSNGEWREPPVDNICERYRFARYFPAPHADWSCHAVLRWFQPFDQKSLEAR